MVGFYIGSSDDNSTVDAGALFISTAVITALTMLVSEVQSRPPRINPNCAKQVATRLLLPKPSAGNITVTNLIKFTSLNLLFSISVLFTFLVNYFFTSSALSVRKMVGIQQNAMLVCLLFTNKEVN